MNLAQSDHAQRRREREYLLFVAYGQRLNAHYPYKDADRMERVVPDALRPEFEHLKRRTHELMARINGWEVGA